VSIKQPFSLKMSAWKLSIAQEKGQVTIPAEIRKKLGLKKADYVAFVETDQDVLISPQEIVAQEALDEIGQILKEKGLTLRVYCGLLIVTELAQLHPAFLFFNPMLPTFK